MEKGERKRCEREVEMKKRFIEKKVDGKACDSEVERGKRWWNRYAIESEEGGMKRKWKRRRDEKDGKVKRR